MNALLNAADEITRLFSQGSLTALVAEEHLLALGFHSIEFPKKGPHIRATYLGVTYDLNGA